MERNESIEIPKTKIKERSNIDFNSLDIDVDHVDDIKGIDSFSFSMLVEKFDPAYISIRENKVDVELDYLKIKQEVLDYSERLDYSGNLENIINKAVQKEIEKLGNYIKSNKKDLDNELGEYNYEIEGDKVYTQIRFS